MTLGFRYFFPMMLAVLGGVLPGLPALSYDGKPQPKVATEALPELKDVGIDEQIGNKLDLNLKFKNEEGVELTLGSLLGQGTPVIISPIYFSCPGLCNFHLNGLIDGLKEMDWSPGDKFQVIAVSFDSRETPETAKLKKQNYMQLYGRPGTESGFHFLTGSEESVRALTQSVGFKYKWNEEEKEWAHASAAIVITPAGVISRYLPGISFFPKDIRLALNEAGQGKLGTFVDRMVLYCFKYDNHQSKYTLYSYNIMKLGGALMIMLMALWLFPFWIKARRQRDEAKLKKAL